MTTLRVGYVPEHFAAPLLQLGEKDPSLNLVACPSGTGQMITLLRERSIDVAVALTESLIAGIALGKGDYKLIGTYVQTPLNWAVITGKDSNYSNIEDLKGQKLGISRLGSGSQVMASVMALQQGWLKGTDNNQALSFAVNDSFKNLRDSVNDGTTAAFMWEWFTTKPFADSGEIKFIGNVLTPWSSWMIAANPESTSEALSTERIHKFLNSVSQAVNDFGIEQGVRKQASVDFIKNHFKYSEEDVKDWMNTVAYPADVKVISASLVSETLNVLKAAEIVTTPREFQLNDYVLDTVASVDK